MNRKTSWLVGVVLLVAPLLLGQEPQNRTASGAPDDLASQRLIAWSRMQKPQPVPQPLPSDPQVPQPDQQARPVPPANQQQSPIQTFAGKIVKDGEKYVLLIGHTSYQLDAQTAPSNTRTSK